MKARGIEWAASGPGLTAVELELLKSQHGLKVCGGRLNAPNDIGYCPNHRSLAKNADKWKNCLEPKCENRVKISSETGYCKEHESVSNRPSTENKFCRECRNEGKETELASDNITGFCERHQHLAYRPRKPKKTCSYELNDGTKCGVTIGHNSKSGLCARHYLIVYADKLRHSGARRTQDSRQRMARDLEKYQRIADEAKAKVKELTEKLSRTQPPQERVSYKTGASVAQVVPIFEQLFSLPTIKENPETLKDMAADGCFSKRHIDAAARALNQRDNTNWPTIAARHFISEDTRLSFDVVAKYHRNYLAKRAS